MADVETAKRYAQAVFELAEEAGKLAIVRDDLNNLRELMETNAEFANFINNPLIDNDQRQSTLDALLKGKIDELSLRFLRFLDAKTRLDALAIIAIELNSMYLFVNNIIEAKVISARAISSEQTSTIRQRLEKRFDKEIKLEVDIDPDLIGGFLVKVGDTVFDFSISHQLNKVKQKIISA